jgi:hypothetical protein
MRHTNEGDIPLTEVQEHLGCVLSCLEDELPKCRGRMRAFAAKTREIRAVFSSKEIRHQLI